MVERKLPKAPSGATEDVGRGKPPKATRFKPGECGNPKGRPKGSKNVLTHIREEMNVRIDVTEDGKRRKISKSQAVAKRLVNKAVEGDPKAAMAIMAQEKLQADRGGGGAGDTALQRPEDELTMESILNRIRATLEESRALGDLNDAMALQTSDEAATAPAEPDAGKLGEQEAGQSPVESQNAAEPEENP